MSSDKKGLINGLSGKELWEQAERKRQEDRERWRLLQQRDLEGQQRAKARRAKEAAEEEAMVFDAEEGDLHHDRDEEILEGRTGVPHAERSPQSP